MSAAKYKISASFDVEQLLAYIFIILWLCYLILNAPDNTILYPDSQGYIHFYSSRSAGYPLFLMVTGVDTVKFVQPFLATLSLFVLYCESRKLFTRYSYMSLLLVIGIGANARFFSYHYAVLTESLYVSLLVLIAAVYMRYVRMPSSKWTLAILSSLCGLSVIVRPSAIYLLPALLIGLVMVWNSASARKVSLIAICILPMLTIISIEKAFSSSWHNGQSDSKFKIHAFAKAALIDGSFIRDSSEYGQALEDEFLSVRRFVWSAPGFYVRNHFLSEYEICIQYTCADGNGLNQDSEEALQAALNRIRSNISGYFTLTWHNYRSLWTVYPTSTPGVAEKINNFISTNRPFPYVQQLPARLADEVQPQSMMKFIIQIYILLIAIFSAGLIVYGAYRWLLEKSLNPVLSVVVFVSLAMHGSQLLTAMTGVSVIRYTISLWPYFMVFSAGMAVLLLTKRQSD